MEELTYQRSGMDIIYHGRTRIEYKLPKDLEYSDE